MTANTEERHHDEAAVMIHALIFSLVTIEAQPDHPKAWLMNEDMPLVLKTAFPRQRVLRILMGYPSIPKVLAEAFPEAVKLQEAVVK